MSMETAKIERVVIYYDGECPMCRNHMQVIRLRETVGEVSLIDARLAPEAVARFSRLGMDINEGLIVEIDGKIYQGTEAMHRLALLTSPIGGFNRMFAAVFSRPRLGTTIYPGMVRIRNALLWMLGRKPIGVPDTAPPHGAAPEQGR